MVTQDPINIGTEGVELAPAEKIEAITGGAALYIDITSYISADNAVDALREVEKRYPEGCIKTVLSTNSGQLVTLDSISGAWGGDNTQVRLSSSKGVPVGVEFTSIKISSCTEIRNTVVKWINYSK